MTIIADNCNHHRLLLVAKVVLNEDKKRQLIALNIVREEMNKYQKSLNIPVWVDICSAGCDNRASFALFLIISRVKR
ncbi:hypothetical protein VEGS19_A41390 [Escherichia coli]|nr:hypothetical protein VEGS19_A41390 [Escherichia coli]BDW60089.1 hypothetical protein JNE120442_25340 [Escherichia coli]GHM56892.1 hypothetical protein ECZU51_55620 [Escherichia coli]GLB71788.1 hypothetical protein EcoAe3A3_21960 [Escherichia coli]